MEDPEFYKALEKGIALFNEQAFFQAYEVWQERWELECGDGADLLQGLLQIAVGLAKLQGGNPKGTIKLLRTGLEKLAPYAPEAYDVDIATMMTTVEEWQAKAEELVAQGQEGSNTVAIANPTPPTEQDARPDTPAKPWWRRLW